MGQSEGPWKFMGESYGFMGGEQDPVEGELSVIEFYFFRLLCFVTLEWDFIWIKTANFI